jgi:hypothetical protein
MEYKLLKDLPDLKAGAIFEYVYFGMGRHFYIEKGSRLVKYPGERGCAFAVRPEGSRAHIFATDYVTKQKNWFELVEES